MASRYTCTVCHSSSAPQYQDVIRHIGSVHSWEPRRNVTYTSYRSFRKHMLEKHRDVVDNTADPGETVSEIQEMLSGDVLDLNSPDSTTLRQLNSKAHFC